MAFIWVNVNLINFKNMFTTTKMAFVPSHSGRHAIKLVETLSNEPDEIRRGLHNPKKFVYQLGILALHTNANVMFYVFLHFGPLEKFPQQLSHCFLSMVFHHGHIMHFFHDLHAQLSFRHIDSWLLPSKQPIYINVIPFTFFFQCKSLK